MMGPDAMILVFWMLSFKPTFSLPSFTFIKRLFCSSLSAIRGQAYVWYNGAPSLSLSFAYDRKSHFCPFPLSLIKKVAAGNVSQDFLPCTTSSITLAGQADLLKVVHAAAARPQILECKTDPRWQPGKQPLSRDCHKWVRVSREKI